MTELQAWKTSNVRKPLILKGVRQSGKTYLLEQFGKNSFPHTHIINFEKQESVCALFDGDLIPERIIDDLCFALNTKINIKEDLLIFDEIQACPKALTSLKYFCEDLPELAVCAAGSLLGLHVNEGSFPVGKVDMLYLYPLTFHEFLEGIGDQFAADYLHDIDIHLTISDAAHQRFWQRLKQYFVTGGLPEVVATFAKYQDNLFTATNHVRQKQDQLIQAYYADIAKHSGKINAMHIDRTWRSIPMQLSQSQDGSAKKFKFKGILPHINRYAQLVNVIDWLTSAELALPVHLLNTIEQPLLAHAKQNSFKLLMFDVGILGAMSGLDPKLLLDYSYGSYKGFFAENFVATQLLAGGIQQLLSWQSGRSEVEFLIVHEGSVMPVEVKAGNIIRAKSLQKYCEKYKPEKSIILSARNMKVDMKKRALQLPLYLAEHIQKFV